MKSKTTTGNHLLIGDLPQRIKQFFLLMALIVLATAMYAGGSELEIKLWNNQSFEIQLDQRTHYADREFIATALTPGQHRIKVIQRQHSFHGNGGKVTVLYNGSINVGHDSKVIAEVRPNRSLKILRTIQLRPHHTTRPVAQCGPGGKNYGQGGLYNEPSWNYGGNNGGFGTTYQESCSCGCGAPMGSCSSMTCGPGCSGCDMCGGMSNYISNQEIDALICELNAAWFDNERLAMAKQRIRRKQLSSFHVRRILDTFDFDFDCHRLEFAKFAHSRVLDPQNFCVVHDAFDFNSNIHELHDFIYG